ncbi:hypothetical protein ACWEV3_03220 [Saccharopolyspora sp. NPDC003752]
MSTDQAKLEEARRRLRKLGVQVLVGATMATGVALVGPAAVASAEPPPASATPNPGQGQPGGARKVIQKIKGVIYEIRYPDTLDPGDPRLREKVIASVVVRRLEKGLSTGKTSVSIADAPDLADDVAEAIRRTGRTTERLKKRLNGAEERITKHKDQLANAKTPRAKATAARKLEQARNRYNSVFREYMKAKKAAEPFDWDKEVNRLTNRLKDFERAAKSPRLTAHGRQQAEKQVDEARAELEQAREDRDRIRSAGRDDDEGGDTTGTSAKPKKPDNGGTDGTTAERPSTGKVRTQGRLGRLGTRLGTIRMPRGYRGGGTGLSQVYGELLGQAYADHVAAEHQETLRKAMRDPALRKRIIDDYNDIKDNNHLETFGRAFDTSKGFTQGTTRDIGPKLVEYQKQLDTTRKNADESNADPLYRQARHECGGYDTCVTERTKRLRDRNAREVADSTKKARTSNADPSYQQARRECGGYDTCVTERTKRLRKEEERKARVVAPVTKKARTSNADPSYQQARRECGGYDTCVTDRTKRLRDQKKTNDRAVADATKQARRSANDPLYQQAQRECGGYDTCVQSRVKKLRSEKTARTDTKTPKTKAQTKKSSRVKVAS